MNPSRILGSKSWNCNQFKNLMQITKSFMIVTYLRDKIDLSYWKTEVWHHFLRHLISFMINITKKDFFNNNTFKIISFFFLSFSFFLFFICSEFCHILKWKGLGFTCLPHPDPPSHLPPHPAYTPRKPDLKETHAPQCSSQHCLS